MRYAAITITLLTALTATATGADAQTCPGFDADASVNTRLEHNEIDESSGLAASARHPGLFWTHNDSGDDARLFLLDGEGKHVGTLALPDTTFVDAEDVAVAPCERGGSKHCIYVGDIGDNRSRRPQVTVYKIHEPALPDSRPVELEADRVEPIVLRYQDGARDAEALMIHPDTLELIIVEKSKGTAAGVWRAMADTRGQPDVQVATKVAAIEIPSPLQLGRYVTAGDFSPDASRFSLRTYLSVFTWCVGEGESLADALAREPTVSATPGLIQSEALAYDRDGESIWLTSERRPTPLIELKRETQDQEQASPNATESP